MKEPTDPLDAVRAADAPVVLASRGAARVLATPSEPDATAYQVGDRSYYFKRFRSLVGDEAFLYDAMSGDVHRITALEWELLDDLPLHTADEHVDRHPAVAAATVRAAVERLWSELQPVAAPELIMPEVPDYSDAIRRNLIRTLTVNTTEQCNLRCTYCYYGGGYDGTRAHNDRRLARSTLRAAIDRFLEHHEETRGLQRAVYLFGGEPLLNFTVVREAVLYTKAEADRRGLDIGNVIFQVATNGIPLREEVVEFLVEHGVHVNVSIDGPTHDQHRVDRRGRGTLALVTERLESLLTAHPAYFETHVGLVCVVTPPVDVAALYSFFTSFQPAAHALHLDFDLVLTGGTEVGYGRDELRAAKRQLWELFVRMHGLTDDELAKSWVYFFTTGFNFLHMSFWRALWRPRRRIGAVLEAVAGARSIPGMQQATLGADGRLYASYEYQSADTVVGSADGGLDQTAVMALARSFRDACNASACRNCWAARVCSLDYPDFAVGPGDGPADLLRKLGRKQARCADIRDDAADALAAVESIRAAHGDPALTVYASEQRELTATQGACWLPMEDVASSRWDDLGAAGASALR